eukprot:3142802-Pyramimonas_sp.AAC.1
MTLSWGEALWGGVQGRGEAIRSTSYRGRPLEASRRSNLAPKSGPTWPKDGPRWRQGGLQNVQGD